ncbi:MAG: DUF2341 domain-containing protein [Candidatus Thermoplasmatota archaeon]|jgi:hypothetical protein|nr:DUF2341 domain-containing protein [Candidatus Thermoplasmatota archaeon]
MGFQFPGDTTKFSQKTQGSYLKVEIENKEFFNFPDREGTGFSDDNYNGPIDQGDVQYPSTRQDEPGLAGSWYDDFDNEDKIDLMKSVTVGDGKVNMNYWRYKKPISVTNNQGLINAYQTLVTLNLSVFNYSHASSNGNDLRFIDEQGNEMAYWIQLWNPNGLSKIWVNVTEMSNGTSRIWMHYGNPTAGRRSDGTKVFELFDDFEDEQVGNSVIPGGWTLDSAGTNRFGVANKDGSKRWWQYCERYAAQPPNGGRAKIYKRTNTMNNWSFEGKVLTYNAYSNNLYTPWLLAAFGTSTVTAFIRHVNPDHVCFIGGSGYRAFEWTDNTWYDFKITYDGQVYKLYFDNELKASWWHPGDSTDRFYLGSGYFGKNYYDLPRVRKYISEEPVIQVGGEISNPLPHIVSKPITLPESMRRYTLSVTKVETLNTLIGISVLRGTSNASIQGFSNLTEKNINLSALPDMNISNIRLVAWFTGSEQSTPILDSWEIEWMAKYPKFIMNISDIMVTEETPEANILDLSNHFWDEYSGEKPHSYHIEYISDPTKLIVKLEGSILDLLYLADNFTGMVNLRMNYTNGYDLRVSSNLFGLIVQNIDDAPTWVSGPLQIIISEDIQYVSNFSLADHVFDVEDDDLIFTAFSQDGNLTVGVDDNNSLFVIPEMDYFGKQVITVEVRENTTFDLFAQKVITIIVEPVNDPPRVVMDIGDRFLQEDSKLFLDVENYFWDPDDTDLLFLFPTDIDNISLSIFKNNSLLIEPSSGWFGETIVSIGAIDPWGKMAMTFFKVEVIDINDIPRAIIEPFSEEIVIGSEGMMLTGYGEDEDGHILEYLWESSVDNYLGNNTVLDLAAISSLSQGRHIISFSVKDDDGAWSPAVRTEILITVPLLEIEDFFIEGTGFKVGDEVSINVRIANRGTALVEDLTLSIRVDGTVINSLIFPYIFAGEIKDTETIWLAKAGTHNISVEIIKSDDMVLELSDGVKTEKVIEVEKDRGIYLVASSIGFSLVLIILFFVTSSLLKRRRRRKILQSLRSEIKETSKKGVGVVEAEDMYKKCKDEFG